MTLEDHFRHTFAELTDRISSEVSRQVAAAAEELIAAADRDAEGRVATALAAPVDDHPTPNLVPDEQPRAEGLAAIDRLLDAVRALDGAASLSDILDTLTVYAGAEMARAAVLLVRGSTLEGRRFVGFGPDLDGARKLEMPLDEAGLIATTVRTRALASTRDSAPLFAGLPPEREYLALPLVVAGDVVAVLYGDDGVGDTDGIRPSSIVGAGRVSALEVVVRHAARCLEVITALRTAQIVARASGAPIHATPSRGGGGRVARDVEG